MTMSDDQLFDEFNNKITSIINTIPIAYMRVELHLSKEIRDNRGNIYNKIIILPGASRRLILSDTVKEVPFAEWEIFTRLAVFKPEIVEQIRSAIETANNYTRNKIQEFLSH